MVSVNWKGNPMTALTEFIVLRLRPGILNHSLIAEELCRVMIAFNPATLSICLFGFPHLSEARDQFLKKYMNYILYEYES